MKATTNETTKKELCISKGGKKIYVAGTRLYDCQ